MVIRPDTARRLMLRRGRDHYEFYNEDFPVFWNDVDLCSRAAEVGVRIALVKASRIVHGLAHSSKKSNREMLSMLFYSHAGMIGYARRWGHHPNLLRAILFLDLVFFVAIKLEPVRRKRSVSRDVRAASRAQLLKFRCSLL
jgi:GT2 family glycosyltransferase